MFHPIIGRHRPRKPEEAAWGGSVSPSAPALSVSGHSGRSGGSSMDGALSSQPSCTVIICLRCFPRLPSVIVCTQSLPSGVLPAR